MIAELQGFPLFNQLTDFTVDGRPDEGRLNNCGEECCAMIVKYVTGVELPADYIKDQIYGEAHTGYSYPNDLATWLSRWASIPSVVVQANSFNMQRIINNQCIDQGLPSILLIDFLQPDVGGHFVCPVAYDEGGLYVADPWGGFRRFIAWTEFPSWTQGLLVRCLRGRDPHLPDE